VLFFARHRIGLYLSVYYTRDSKVQFGSRVRDWDAVWCVLARCLISPKVALAYVRDHHTVPPSGAQTFRPLPRASLSHPPSTVGGLLLARPLLCVTLFYH